MNENAKAAASVIDAVAQMSAATPYQELGLAMKELDNVISSLDRILKDHKKAREQITDFIVPEKMNADGISTINLKGIGRFSIRDELRVSAKGDKKQDLQVWLEENGYEELISTTINSSTLKAFVKERMVAGEDYPDEFLNIHMFERATLTKK